MPRTNVKIIGIGMNGLKGIDASRIRDIEESSILIGSKRILNLFNGLKCRKYYISKRLDELIDLIKENRDKKVVVLATGDPNLYGISDILLRNFSKEELDIYPSVSYMQEAFAKIRETMNDSLIISLHGRKRDSLMKTILTNKKIGIFMDHENNAETIVQELIRLRIRNYRLYICEDLGTDKENISEVDLNIPLLKENYSCNSIMILIKRDIHDDGLALQEKPCIEVTDENIFHRGNMITKPEVRAVTVSKLSVKNGDIVWDIGAGCGSISLEIASIFQGARLFAVEKDVTQYTFLMDNIERFRLFNIEAVCGEAPDILSELPAPDRVVVGGTGGRIDNILEYIDKRLKDKGIIVLNAVTLETVERGRYFMENNGYKTDIILLNISRKRSIGDKSTILEGLNTVFILSGVKNGQ